MKTRITFLFLLLGAAQLLSSCLVSYGDHTTSEFSRLETIECAEKPQSMHLFFENETLDFEYRKVGTVEASGGDYDSNEDVLNHLKFQAWNNCANGLILVSSGYQDREKGYLFDSEDPEYYSSKYYHAVAVQINTDSVFLARHGAGDDLSFADQVLADYVEQANQTSDEVGLSIFATVLITVISIASGSGS